MVLYFFLIGIGFYTYLETYAILEQVGGVVNFFLEVF